MNKKLVSAILCGAMVLAAATPVMADGGVADGKKIALVGNQQVMHSLRSQQILSKKL